MSYNDQNYKTFSEKMLFVKKSKTVEIPKLILKLNHRSKYYRINLNN